MEKSIKRVEKLVHATNSALAQMKFSLMFDDLSGSKNGKLSTSKGFVPAFYLEGDDLKKCQDEFKSETEEMLTKVETMFTSNEFPRKNWKPLDRMKEINRKMNQLKLDHSKHEETLQSRQKLLTLINEEKFSPRVPSSGSVASQRVPTIGSKTTEKPLTTNQNVDSFPPTRGSPIESKEELKNKILETQEIVNRGFRTARKLTQKMESLSKNEKKERTPSSDKTVSEDSWKSLGGKSESAETISAVKCRKCLKLRRRKKKAEEIERVNARIIELKGNNRERCGGPSLRLQRLPSLHIKGGLQLQKIHDLEIPAGGELSTKANTSVRFLSHEKIENEKLEESVEKVRKENFCSNENNTGGNYVECCNCGKLMRILETRVDAQKVDEILRLCNFNVFDPRIDEFVDGCGRSGNFLEKRPSPNVLSKSRNSEPEPPVKETGETGKTELRDEIAKKSGHLRLRDLSDRLLKKYKKEAEDIESSHFKLDRILENIFREVDESREVFEGCNLGKSGKDKKVNLSTSKPVLISLTGTSSKASKKERKSRETNVRADGKKTRSLKSSKERISQENPPTEGNEVYSATDDLKVQEIKEIEEEQSLEMSFTSNNCVSERLKKNTKESSETVEITKIPERKEIEKKCSDLKTDTEKLSCFDCERKMLRPKDSRNENVKAESKNLPSSALDCSASKSNPPDDEGKTEGKSEEIMSPSNTSSERSEDNYESDFESVTNEPGENGERKEHELGFRTNKLSTISEVDSEMEIKVSDEQKIPISGENTGRSFERGSRENPEVKESKFEHGNEGGTKNTAGELVTALKDVLSALQDQFARTESLAEKLTEGSKAVNTETWKSDSTLVEVGTSLNPWKISPQTNLVGNLLSSRKARNGECSNGNMKLENEGSNKFRQVPTGDSFSDEGGSSLGEIRLSDRREKRRGRRKRKRRSESNSFSDSSFTKCESAGRSLGISSIQREVNGNSPFHFDVNIEEILYSEGEIPSEELERSVGEVLSGKILLN